MSRVLWVTGWIGRFSFGVFDETAISCQVGVGDALFPNCTNTALDFILMLVGLMASRQWPKLRTYIHVQGEGAGKGHACELGPVPFVRSSEAPGKPQRHSSGVDRLELLSRRIVAAGNVGSAEFSL